MDASRPSHPLWSSPEAALRDGVQPRDLVVVHEQDMVRITSGPFKGRVYQRFEGRLIRRKELER